MKNRGKGDRNSQVTDEQVKQPRKKEGGGRGGREGEVYRRDK